MRPHLLCIGGVDHALRIRFLLALRDRGFWVTAAGTGDPAPFAQAGLDYIPYHFKRELRPLADWTALTTLSRMLANVRPDITQSFDTKPNLFVPFAVQSLRNGRNIQVVRTINGLAWVYSSRSPMAGALRPLYRNLHRLAGRSAAVTVFQNSEDQAFFEHHRMVGKGGSFVIPGSGADIEGFERAAADGPSPEELRRALGLGAAEVVVTVTRMTREKGIPALLEAAALVHQVRPSVRFLLVGPRQSEGRSAVTQAEFDRHAGYVTVTGPRSDIPALLGLADVFAFPTEYREGVPRVLLEAGLARLPIVTTSMPGCTDVVRHGWSGYVVPPREPRILADRILDMLRDRKAARAMGGRAFETVTQRFDLASIVASYAGLYAQLLNPSARRWLMNKRGDAKASAPLSAYARVQP